MLQVHKPYVQTQQIQWNITISQQHMYYRDKYRACDIPSAITAKTGI